MSIDDMAVYIANLGDYVEGGVKGVPLTHWLKILWVTTADMTLY